MYSRLASLTAAEPRATALINATTGAITTRADLLGRAEELAAQLAAAGLLPGDLVAIQLPNSVDFIASWLAILKLRLVAVPIDRDAPETEIAAILGHFSIRGLIYRRDRSTSTVAISMRAVDARPPAPESARLIKMTSGSTGNPKGIVTSEDNLAADFENIRSSMGITAADINLGAIPFSHSYGFSNLVTPLVMQGTAIVMSNDYLPQSIIDLCNKYSCTVMPGIPMMFDHLITTAHGEFRSARTFISAGAPLPPAVSRRFRERFHVDIHSFYGCSECGGITYDRRGGAVERGSVGTSLDGVSIDISNLRVNVQSRSVALGYLHDAATFEPFEAGRFTTDDLVEIRDDGEVALTGRASELINTAGKKVNPREVEQIILQINGVRQAKVYGEPAGARGEVVAAAVVASPDVTRDQIREFCRQRLSPHKVPRIVKLIESIPVDERGKVKRAALALL